MKHNPIYLEVMADIVRRNELGIRKYGEELTAEKVCNNYKTNLQNLYEELLDAAMYIKKEIMEDACNLPS
jgi:hypothetical protein